MTSSDIASYAGDAIAVCAVIAAVWKPPAGSALYPIYAVINAIGANIGKAKNNPATPATGAEQSPGVNIGTGVGPKG